ncbi:hypothetical protein GGTG_01250 [Gaeumannomyces tritici R3-111a-1]|uniref:Cx9C motif-containing protein 4, mitochondrial n=1 Tax=Gaeumannomyces tritici (strain R3-111a-1) TaxID=644352 RepID=J3NJ16_GAET3|nr:hypothetical protein GGTG_01250 [Gaeumannomyces tritici R3-111a-1]EJT81266.1 hypothetical protein GGTG_01250 [Gaeumannomyces tritici R3-111a-1]
MSNANTMLQGFGRLVRIGQSKPVTWQALMVDDTAWSWPDSRMYRKVYVLRSQVFGGPVEIKRRIANLVTKEMRLARRQATFGYRHVIGLCIEGIWRWERRRDRTMEKDCLTKNGYKEDKCQMAIDALYECCKAFYDKHGEQASSVSCPTLDLLRLKMKQRQEAAKRPGSS